MTGDGIEAEYATLEHVSSLLTDAGDDFSSLREPPAGLDAGPLTPLFAAVTAHLAEQAELLTGKLGGAGEAVLSARHIYERTDAAARDDLSKPQ